MKPPSRTFAETGSLRTRHAPIPARVLRSASTWLRRLLSARPYYRKQLGIDAVLAGTRVALSTKPEARFANRKRLPFPHPAVLDCFRDRAVLITGAGGSIGSELSRQAITLGISKLILLDRDENSVFEIHSELSSQLECPELLPIVGDFRDSALLGSVLLEHHPEIVIHCAAYKHVPLMQTNISEAVLNNVVGTRDLADIAIEFGVERFVMISSDKAVRPTSVMGATKRAAELLLQSRARRSSDTRFASVRFGNVAGSRGSVIPIFAKQIEEGKPVTVTDERMTRYFMTISDAVQLVMQASALAGNGDIYVLEMGDPVPVTTLATKLILMSGQRPGKDIPIRIIGIRPGEKLHEQLCYEDDTLLPTEFERVYRVESDEFPSDIDRQVVRLENAARDRRDAEVLEQLRALPIGFLAPDTSESAYDRDARACKEAGGARLPQSEIGTSPGRNRVAPARQDGRVIPFPSI